MKPILSIFASIFLLFILFVAGCGDQQQDREQTESAPAETMDTISTSRIVVPDSSFAGEVGIAHGIDRWQANKAIEGDLKVVFNGEERLAGKMVAETSVGKVRIELNNGTTLIWDGNKAWVSPDTASIQGARFHLRTWPYFLAAPMKLADPGTQMVEMNDENYKGQSYERRKLLFESNVGDTPEDWYVLYKDKSSDQLKAMAYIVTYGKGTEKAEEEPHAIVYDEYTQLDGIMLSNSWKFYNWSEEEGIHGDSIGYVTVENLSFTEPDESLFAKPENAREDKMPE